MKLLYDLRATQPNLSGKRHGGGRYGEVIFHRMAERGFRFGCFYDSRLWFNPEVAAVVRACDLPLYDVAHCSVQSVVNTEHYDRVYTCLLGDEVARLTGCQVYATAHGLRGLETPADPCFWHYRQSAREQLKFVLQTVFPGWWRRRLERRFRRNYVGSGAHLVAVSEHTRQAIRIFFPELKDRNLQVFYSPNTSTGDDRPIATGERYLLCVSGNRWEKNNLRAIEALDRLIDAGLVSGVRMKVAGARAENLRYRMRHPEAFDLLGYVDDHELERLYAGAYLFVYPSLNEGFGYPPLEAMRYGVPVIASPFSSMADILDQGALYFNPFLVEEIMNRMLMMMDPIRHAEFARRGHEQYLRVSQRQREDLEGVIDYIME